MNERENILGRIREALRVPSPVPGAHDCQPAKSSVSERDAAPHIPEWLPRVGFTFEDRLALFQKNAADLKAEFFIFETPGQLHAKLAEIAAAEGWKKIATQDNDQTEAAAASLGLPVIKTTPGYDVHELESCDAGISVCEALVAQTGSVLVTSKSSGGRALSVLPPHHVVIARREQLIADLPAAFALIQAKYGPANYPSMVSFITGPSRTGDIERILVLGAHGPKKLTILCV